MEIIMRKVSYQGKAAVLSYETECSLNSCTIPMLVFIVSVSH